MNKLAMPSNHEHFMRLALIEAQAAADAGDVPVGCVIVKDDVVVGRGGNAIQQRRDPTRHAEMMAIEDAVAVLDAKFLEGCTLYVTLEPCAMCAGAIVLARIPTVVYGAADPKTGACRSVFEIVDDPRLNHRCIVRTGILEDECSAMLTSFFEARRAETDEEKEFVRQPSTTDRHPLEPALYLVPTPIGNLDDITRRAEHVLRTAEVIACEDTRHTGSLLRLLGIHAPRLLSNHDHNEQERASLFVQLVREGKRVAIVSDAGMPAISDPGFRAVRACAEAGISVIALPGPCAFVTAAAASGLPTNALYFGGFPPQKKGRQTFMRSVLQRRETVVLYESPYRVGRLLEEVVDLGGANRQVVVAREVSKKFEEYLRGTATEVAITIATRGGVKGECVVLIAGLPSEESDVHLV